MRSAPPENRTILNTVRFAFKTATQNTTWQRLLAVWKAADDIEVYESGWTFDHFYPIFSDRRGPCLEGWTTLTALAAVTKRLRLGTLVTGIHHRHPAVLANMAAAVDVISGGRLELGIGAGWNVGESRAYGLGLGTITERLDRFEEACQVLIGLLSHESFDFQGRYYRLHQARNEPKGPQRPHPPICIGGSGEKRTLRIAARYAQHWNFVGGSRAKFRHRRDVLHQHCAEVGRDPAEIQISAHVRLHPDLDYRRAVADAAGLGALGLDLAIFLLPEPHDPAVLEPLAAAIRDAGLLTGASAGDAREPAPSADMTTN